jgi:predicted nucleotidyltransferase
MHSLLDQLREAADPTYYQDTFYFTILISMSKDLGGSRDETKNDIRALPEVLTVTLVEAEKGGVQRDIGSKYLSTLKVHARRPKNMNKRQLMKRLVLNISNLRGVSVMRYKESKPKQRRKPFRGQYDISETSYQQNPRRKANLRKAFNRYTKTGPNKSGPFKDVTDDPDWKSAPPGAPGGLEEAHLDEAMKTAADLPEDVVVVASGLEETGFQVYYALRDNPTQRLKAGDLDRMEAGIDIFGTLYVERGGDEPYDGVYIVTSAKAKDGFGPLLYDVALELAGDGGLKPDPLDVSDEASAVWKHYATQRDDVSSQPLVDTHEFDLVMPPERAENPEENDHLSHKYIKTGKTTIEELRGQGQFIELKSDSEVPTPSPREELTDLAAELDIPIVSNKDLSRFDRLYEQVLITISHGQDDDDLMAFDVQPTLNQKIWDGDLHIRPGTKGALMHIVEEFMDGLDMDLDLKDVIVTGSIANFNWSKFSDIDLHLLVDFGDVNDNEEMVKKFFDAVRSNWNKLHNILVKGHEVEIYVQDDQEPHISTGVYSLMDDKWLVKPKKIKPELDRVTAIKKMRHFAREIDKLSALFDRGDHEGAYEMAQRLKSKLKRMRQGGLERAGIYSPENLAFKMLRRSGDIEQLFSIYTQAYDHIHSLDQ